MDRFSQGSDGFAIACEKENRRLGAALLLIGAVCTWATWYLGPKRGMLYGGRLFLLILSGAIFSFFGLAKCDISTEDRIQVRSE